MMIPKSQAILLACLLAGAAVLSGGVVSGQGKPAKPGQPDGEAPVEQPGGDDELAGPANGTEPTAPLAPPGPPPDEELGFALPQISAGAPITLNEAVVRADRRNPGLSSARLEIQKAEAQLKQAWGLVLPGAQAGMQLMHRDHEDAVNFGGTRMVFMSQDDLKGSISVGMPLVNAQNWLTVGAAKQGVRVAEYSIEDARQQLLMGVAIAYVAAVQIREYIALSEEQARSAAHHLKIARARFEVGTGLKIDVIRAETNLEQTRQDLLQAHLAFDNARDTLGTLTGTGGLPLPVATPPLEVPGGDEQQLVSQAVSERAQLRAKDELIKLMDRQLDASWMQ
ncbi:MAG: TolC family protein, partial [Deltaproteobacteria bacterium]|nr:TolC family protein [Deltaproteobacteria bacterium]